VDTGGAVGQTFNLIKEWVANVAFVFLWIGFELA